jgi:hypothetical protein
MHKALEKMPVFSAIKDNEPTSMTLISTFARSLIGRCNSRPQYKVNINVGRSQMPRDMLVYLTAISGADTTQREYESERTPLKLADVYKHYIEMSRRNRTKIPFGVYRGIPQTLCVTGRVECWDGYTDSLLEEGTLTINLSPHVKEHIDVIVLGYIAETGTGVLVDTNERVWLYNPKNAVDGFLEGTTERMAALILNPGSMIKRSTNLKFLDVYQDSSITVYPEDGELEF